jgi:polyhydroxybutyrate depolymerase
MVFSMLLRRFSRRAQLVAVFVVILAVVATIAGVVVGSRTPAAGPSARAARAVVAAHVGDGSHGRSAAETKPVSSNPGAAGDHATAATSGPGRRPAAVPGVHWTSGSMQVGTLRRAWWLATPEHATNRRLPLLMIMHGRGSTPAIEAARTGFLSVVAQGDAIAVYPAGYDNSWNAGRCCGKAHTAAIDDLDFLHQLVLTMDARPDVDPNDLDLVGFSNGAKMAFDLVCSGTLLPQAMAVAEAVPTTDCDHPPAVPLVQVAGTADPIVPYAAVDPKLTAGGIPLTPVVTEVTAWAARNGCSASTISEQADRSAQTWSGCKSPVALLTYPGGVHAWQADATPYIWQFLQAQAPPVT